MHSHEWSKHGTCSGLPQQTYYQTAINVLLTLGTPAIISNNVGKTVSASDIRAAFGGSSWVALQCADGNQLSGAFTCWNQAGDVPTVQVACVGEVAAEDTCTSSEVTIVSLTTSGHGPKGSF
jgi:ribonuclease T2